MTHSPSSVASNADLVTPHIRSALAVLPGLLMASVVAGSAYWLRELPGMRAFSPLILAILIGTAFHNLLGTPAMDKTGVAFSVRRLLRFGIILLGFQLTVSLIVEVGDHGFLIIAATLAATFVFTVLM